MRNNSNITDEIRSHVARSDFAFDMKKRADDFHKQAEEDLPRLIIEALSEKVFPVIQLAAQNGDYNVSLNLRDKLVRNVFYEHKIIKGIVEKLQDLQYFVQELQESVLYISWEK